jgi:starch-binding outer membrane protein, SusD/RagB family
MKLKITLSLALAAATLGGCIKSKLEPVPQTALGDAVSFSDSTRCVQQVNGCYAALKSGNFLGGRYLVYQDVKAEEFLNITNNGVTAWLVWQFNLNANSTEPSTCWNAAYAAINRCNVVIEGVTGSPISAALKANLIAEAKVVRATAYFSLLQLYARPFNDNNGNNPGVPLRLTPEKSSGNNNLARSTVAEVYTQILKDLNEAEPALPLGYGTNVTLNTTRAHRNTAIALKTRVYLNMGRYADVVTEANKIVPLVGPWQAASGVQNRLEASIATVFSTYTSQESIFSLPFSSLDLPGTQNGLGHYYNPGPNGNGDFALNLTGNGIVANTDWRPADARRAFNIVGGTQTWLRKWTNNPGSAPDWAPVIRYAEVMLSLAESLARTAAGTTVDARALAILNAVRMRSDATNPPFAPADKNALIALILTERRIELLGEGVRTSDIGRTGSSFPAKGTVSAVAPSSPLYIWPIPFGEISINTACTQNPSY